MEAEEIFRTKTGFCHILPNKIVLTRNGIRGSMAQVAVGNGMARPLIIYALVSIVLLFSAFDSYRKGELFWSIFFVVLSIYLLRGILNSLNNSATPVIDRNQIKQVIFRKGITGLTRSRFEVFFVDENNKIKKRLIMLPGLLSDGNSETQKALAIMANENLLPDR